MNYHEGLPAATDRGPWPAPPGAGLPARASGPGGGRGRRPQAPAIL